MVTNDNNNNNHITNHSNNDNHDSNAVIISREAAWLNARPATDQSIVICCNWIDSD